MENHEFHPNLDIEYQIATDPSQFSALPPALLLTLSVASSSEDHPAPSLVEKPSCCMTARSCQKEIHSLSRRLHLKDTTLLYRNEQLQRKEAELLEKEASIKELKQNLQQISHSNLLLRQDIEVLKLGNVQVDGWRSYCAMLENLLLAKSLGPLVVEMEAGGSIPIPPEN